MRYQGKELGIRRLAVGLGLVTGIGLLAVAFFSESPGNLSDFPLLPVFASLPAYWYGVSSVSSTGFTRDSERSGYCDRLARRRMSGPPNFIALRFHAVAKWR
jgi:hypothetical protein